MQKHHFGVAALLACTTMSGPAFAWWPTVADCGSSSDALVSAVNSLSSPGTTIQVKGVCSGDVTITWDGTTIQNFDPSGDAIAGQVWVSGAHGVTIDGSYNGASQGLTITAPPTSNGEVAGVLVSDGGVAAIKNVLIEEQTGNGLFVYRAAASIISSHITGNGTAGNPHYNSGILVSDNAALRVGGLDGSGNPDPSQSVEIDSNSGAGIFAGWSSSLELYVGNVHDNGNAALSLVFASGAHVLGTASNPATLSVPANGTTPVVTALGSSSLQLIDASLSGPFGGLIVEGGSSLLALGSSFTSTLGTNPTVEASDNSSIILGGGNSITNSASGGLAVSIDHLSSLRQRASAIYGYPPVAETISGNGLVQEQSTAELGVGPIGGQFGLSWTGAIQVQQNSSFRLSGGVNITGTVSIQHAANGFFNFNNDPAGDGTVPGGADYVSGGVSCLFTNVAASHVTNPTDVTPTAVPVASGYTSATAGQCLSF